MTENGKCAIVGANGFLGRNLALHLEGEFDELRLISRSFRVENGDTAGTTRFHLDIETAGKDEIRAAIGDAEVVLYLAAATTPGQSKFDLKLDIEKNLLPFLKFLSAIRDCSVRKLIFASSGGTVYGSSPFSTCRETDGTYPISGYGISKLASEEYLKLACRLAPIDYSILRISNPYGPFQDIRGGQGVVAAFIGRILANEPLVVWGLSLIHI